MQTTPETRFAKSGGLSIAYQVVGSGPVFQSLFFVGLVLFLITLSLNVVASRFVASARQKY